MITSGALRAGDRLPRQADLAAGLGLSRSSLREAVRALAAHDPEMARSWATAHIAGVEQWLASVP